MAITSKTTSAEFALMLGDVGVPVVYGTVNSFGVLDFDDVLAQGESGFASGAGAGMQKRGEVIGRQLILTVPAADFVNVAIESDAPIQVDGNGYVVSYALEHSHMALDLVAVFLRKA